MKTGSSSGDGKSAPNEVGGIATTPPDEVDAAIEKLISETPSPMRFEDIVDWHVRFERIHPFHDGNGRAAG
ncbi:Fic family protein [Microbacterium aerolatum]|uniref:Fic family protein n=1 Tax=Microbacterium aerolatum TaxID=153731 RepID=UPI00384ACD1F